MFNSVIIAHRNRPTCLRVILRSLLLASQNAKSSYEVIIADLKSSSSSKNTLNLYKDTSLNLKVLDHKYGGPFWKTKALNSAARHAAGHYITMIDVDSIVNCNFFSSTEEFFADNKNKKNKLAYRVFYLSPVTSKIIYKKHDSFDCDFLSKRIWNPKNTYSKALERYTGKERFLGHISSAKHKMAMQQWALGNSHFTMKKKYYMDIGGYDEKFIGHGLEDLDFNLRTWRYLHSGTLRPQLEYAIFHVTHKKEGDWFDMSLRERNRKVYRENKRKRKTVIPMSSDWGIF